MSPSRKNIECSSETVISNESHPDISTNTSKTLLHQTNLQPITAGSCQYENKSSNERTVMEETSSRGPSVPVYLQEKQLLNKDIIICQYLRQSSSNEDGSHLCHPKHAVDIPSCKIKYRHWVVPKVSKITPNPHDNIDVTSECTSIVDTSTSVEDMNVEATTSSVYHSSCLY